MNQTCSKRIVKVLLGVALVGVGALTVPGEAQAQKGIRPSTPIRPLVVRPIRPTPPVVQPTRPTPPVIQPTRPAPPVVQPIRPTPPVVQPIKVAPPVIPPVKAVAPVVKHEAVKATNLSGPKVKSVNQTPVPVQVRVTGGAGVQATSNSNFEVAGQVNLQVGRPILTGQASITQERIADSLTQTRQVGLGVLLPTNRATFSALGLLSETRADGQTSTARQLRLGAEYNLSNNTTLLLNGTHTWFGGASQGTETSASAGLRLRLFGIPVQIEAVTTRPSGQEPTNGVGVNIKIE